MHIPFIHIKNMAKNFSGPLKLWGKNEAVLALNNITLSIERGSRVALLGANGAGKTTLLKILATAIIPNQGTVSIGGHTLGKDDDKIKALTKFMSNEDRSFYWRLTGRQNLNFYAALYGLPSSVSNFRINKLLKAFNVNYADKRFDSYSSGMKRKLAFIRAMLHKPDLLLLDEPTKSLDYPSSLELRDFIHSHHQENKTIILATHNFEEAQYLSDLFIILHQGRMLGYGSLDELRQKTGVKSASLTEIYLNIINNAH